MYPDGLLAWTSEALRRGAADDLSHERAEPVANPEPLVKRSSLILCPTATAQVSSEDPVRPEGFEPSTFGLEVRRSIR